MAKTKELDLLLQFDDLIRCSMILSSDNNICEKEFLKYVKNQETMRAKYVQMTTENKRLTASLDTANAKLSLLTKNLSEARKLVDLEVLKKKKAEEDRDESNRRVDDVLRFLLNDPRSTLAQEARERLSSLSRTTSMSTRSTPRNLNYRLDLADESDCTASFMSDTSFSRSEDNLDDSMPSLFSKRRARRSSFADEDTGTVKRRKSVRVETFTPTAPRAESIESTSSDDVMATVKPKPAADLEQNLRTRINSQIHAFVAHNAIVRQSCLYCNKRSGFNHTMWKCKGCSAIAHAECVHKVPMPCIPMGTPRKGIVNTISLYAPTIAPMIPAIVIHCLNEIERRGLTEIGIYKISGSEAGVQALKEKFLKGRGAPNLTDENIHDICSYLKEFLRSLHEPLVPRAEWNTFARAMVDSEKKNRLYHAISLLPQPNRDTLAYLILHLQKVASSRQCKATLSSLASIFGSILVGYSDNEQASALNDAQTARRIMEELLALPADYWCSLISSTCSSIKTPITIRSTPSAESLLKKSSHNLFTPGGRRRFFNTPPLKP